jgi:pyruvate dehydrogenase E2 component (dihydrolipoamide acetyltransferase)
MAEFRMPSLGADMEAGTLVEWKVGPGDAVKRGDIAAVVETDKGAIDIESWEGGVVDEIRVSPGTRVPVGTVLATLRAAGGRQPPTGPAPAAPAAPQPSPPAPPAPASRGGTRASPGARARARQLGVDLAAVRGTGPGGAVTREDVEAATGQAPPAPPSRAAGMRQAIATAMSRSKREIPHYYLGTDIDLSAAVSWLARENERRPVTERLLPIALLLKAAALAARKVPEVNGFVVNGVFQPSAAVHLGLAVSLRQGGLIAPALHDVDRKSLGEVMRDVNDLVARARSSGLRSSELTDPTLTVTSLGDLGVAAVYGVIYPPQVALVGFGKVAERPWAREGRIEARPVLTATLSGDHRASDGSGAHFLAAMDRLLQSPEAVTREEVAAVVRSILGASHRK